MYDNMVNEINYLLFRNITLQLSILCLNILVYWII